MWVRVVWQLMLLCFFHFPLLNDKYGLQLPAGMESSIFSRGAEHASWPLAAVFVLRYVCIYFFRYHQKTCVDLRHETNLSVALMERSWGQQISPSIHAFIFRHLHRFVGSCNGPNLMVYLNLSKCSRCSALWISRDHEYPVHITCQSAQ